MTRRIWILTDGKMGDLVQCRGVAARLDGVVEERVVAPGRPWSWLAPRGPVPPSDRPTRAESPIAPPFPDVLIASGRRTVPYLRAVKRASPDTLTVFLKHPRLLAPEIDLIWAPSHDGLTGKNVIETPTGPHPFTPERLSAERRIGETRFAGLPRPLTGVILGGRSGRVTYERGEAEDVARSIAKAIPQGTALVVTSRRTPDTLRQAVREALAGHWFADDGDGNPYAEVLATADRLIVTGDSHNMVSEAAITGVPIHVYRPEGLAPKLARFLDHMEDAGAVRDLLRHGGDDFPGRVLDASEEIARAIRSRLTD